MLACYRSIDICEPAPHHQPMPDNINRRSAPPGLERSIARLAPSAVAASIALPFFFALASRIFPIGATPDEIERNTRLMDFMLIGFASFFLLAIATILFGCLIVNILKGPKRLADSYPLPHSDKPKSQRDDIEPSD